MCMYIYIYIYIHTWYTTYMHIRKPLLGRRRGAWENGKGGRCKGAPEEFRRFMLEQTNTTCSKVPRYPLCNIPLSVIHVYIYI